MRIKSIAHVHSSVRFWDLRFYNSAFLLSNHSYYLPRKLVCSNLYSLRLLREFYKSDAIVQAEALRFKRPSPSSLQHIPRTSLTPRRILIIGEFNVLLTSALFSLVESSIHSSSKYEIFFKPHPASNLSPSLIPKQNITVTYDDITKIASPDTIILVSSMSSAVFDCLLLGLQTYSHLYGYVNLPHLNALIILLIFPLP